MKAKQVLSLLQVTRPTLTKYVKNGTLQVRKLPNGQYDYQEDSVYFLLNKNVPRKTVIYCRVSSPKQKKDLENQVDLVKSYCFANGLKINDVYTEIASGISFEKRKSFFTMLDDILEHKVEKVIITYKDRLSRVGFALFKYLFDKFNTEIIVISEVGSVSLDSQEIFEEIVSILHCYSMKLYSSRKKKLVAELVSDEG